jgi:transcriptional regulator with GAF, ATPase, and Fis domain
MLNAAVVRMSPEPMSPPLVRAMRAPTPTLVGDSEAFRSIWDRVALVAPTDALVLLLGETGTGKGLFARAIHDRSERRRGRLIEVNCAALPPTLIESELFGRERGAFTDATSSQPGRFELAHGGTIFLDEIGDLPLDLQAKLLRVLQESTVERLGSPRTIQVDVRVIAATNRNIHEEVRQGRFRQDLFYRLNVFPISLPPLRERVGDIQMLTAHFVAQLSKRHGKPIHTIPPAVALELESHDWPGNVRELEHVIERAIITSTDGTLRLAEPLIHAGVERAAVEGAAEVSATRLTDVERQHIQRILTGTAWRIEGREGAASALGLHPSTLRSRMLKLGIRRPAAD